MSELQVGQINSTDGSTAITTGADGYVSFAKTQMGGRKNILLNGSMQVAQRGTSATVSDGSNEGYSTVDRFQLNFNSGAGGQVVMSQSSDAPDGFGNSLKLDVSSTTTFVNSGDRFEIQYLVEGQDAQQFAAGSSNAKQATLSFYAKVDNSTDKFYIAFQTLSGTNTYYFAEFTPTTSWQRFTVTLPAPVSSQIDNNNNAGFLIRWVLGATTSDGASSDLSNWTTTAYRFKNDIGNLLSDTANNFYLTGVQLEVGTVATPFEHRSYGEELALCQRYYWQNIGRTTALSNLASGSNGTFIMYQQAMRAAPTLTSPSTTNFTASNVRDNCCWVQASTTTYLEQLFIDAEL